VSRDPSDEKIVVQDQEVAIDRLIVDGYTQHPPDHTWGDEAARRMIAAEPWLAV
jgi:hypothetical protein